MSEILFRSGLFLDLLIVLLFVFNGIRGLRRGLIDTLYHGFRVIVSAVVAFLFASPLAALLKTTPLYTDILTSLETRLTDYFSEAAEKAVDGALPALTENMQTLLTFLGRTPEETQAEYARLAAEQGADAAEGIVRYIVTPAADAVLKVLCFIVLFLITALVFRLVMKLLNLAAKAPLLHGANKALGLLAGLLIALLHAMIFCMIFDAVLPYLTTLYPAVGVDCIEKTHLYRLIDGINPFALIAVFSAT